jgi:hypothetical protein
VDIRKNRHKLKEIKVGGNIAKTVPRGKLVALGVCIRKEVSKNGLS